MRYEVEQPFVFAGRKVTNMLGVVAAPFEQALADTLRGYLRG